MPSTLHAVDSEFDQRNAALFTALGVISALQGWGELLRRYAPPIPQPLETEAGPTPDVVWVALGLVSLSQTLWQRESLVRPRAAAPFARIPPVSAPTTVPSGWLR
jgi:hypothetical protein